MNAKIQSALDELAKLQSPDEALAVLNALEAKRKETSFIRYWDPIASQRAAVANFKAEIKEFVVLGGNRSGKSELGVAIAVAWALGKEYFKGDPAWEWVSLLPIPEPPSTIWIVALDFPTLRDVIWREKLRMGKDHPGFLPNDDTVVKKVSDTDFQVFFNNGSIITGKSADSGREKFQGASVDLVLIDEEPESDIHDECYQRTLDCAGKILITLTPLTDIASGVRTPWVYDLYEKFQQGQKDVAVAKLSFLDNPFVPETEKTRAREKWNGHVEEKARLYGDFVQRSGMVYNMWDPKLHLIAPQKLPKSWPRWVTIDPAGTGMTAALWAAISPAGDIYLYREYYESGRTISEHAKNILVMSSGDPIDFWIIDPFFGAQRNAETHRTNQQIYRDSGLPVRLAPREDDYGLNESREYLLATTQPNSRHPKMFVFRDLYHFQDEISHYVWAFFQKGEMRGMSKDKPMKGRDHLQNAMQYLCACKPKGRMRGSDVQSPEEYAKQQALNSYTGAVGSNTATAGTASTAWMGR